MTDLIDVFWFLLTFIREMYLFSVGVSFSRKRVVDSAASQGANFSAQQPMLNQGWVSDGVISKGRFSVVSMNDSDPVWSS